MMEYLLNTYVLSCQICEILKYTFVKEYLRTTASEKGLNADKFFINSFFPTSGSN